MKPEYRVEARGEGCPTCQHGDQFDIIDSSECAQSQSWGDPKEAEYICELMNDAFQQGRASYAQFILDTLNKTQIEPETPADPAPAPPPVATDEDIPF